MLGDHEQLPPICEMDAGSIHNAHQDVCLWSLSAVNAESVFKADSIAQMEKLWRQSAVSAVSRLSELTDSFRYSELKASVLSDYVYSGRLHGMADG